MIPPDDEIHHEEEHARGSHDGRDEAEGEAEHHRHEKHANLAAHPHAPRRVLDGAIARRHGALENAQVLPNRPAYDPRMRHDQPLHRQVHGAEEDKDEEKV